jgi:hypothetical protein
MDRDHLAEAKAEVGRLREELEASQRVKAELREGLINAIRGVDTTQERLME